MTVPTSIGIQGAQLYVVATPIGNLHDLSQRASQVLADVDLVACEDTRHTQKLLQHLGLRKSLLSLHDHNERDRIDQIKAQLAAGRSIALVSDAGTPLISDPGYVLVNALRQENFTVTPVPGPSALITALSVAGLPTNRFLFEGFLPHKASGRRERLEMVVGETATLVFYESKHRLLETLAIMQEVLGDRQAVVAREITKTFEQFFSGSLSAIEQQINSHSDHQKGEFVIMVIGADEPKSQIDLSTEKLFKRLLDELPPKRAAAIMSEFTGENKKVLYQRAIAMADK